MRVCVSACVCMCVCECACVCVCVCVNYVIELIDSNEFQLIGTFCVGSDIQHINMSVDSFFQLLATRNTSV